MRADGPAWTRAASVVVAMGRGGGGGRGERSELERELSLGRPLVRAVGQRRPCSSSTSGQKKAGCQAPRLKRSRPAGVRPPCARPRPIPRTEGGRPLPMQSVLLPVTTLDGPPAAGVLRIHPAVDPPPSPPPPPPPHTRDVRSPLCPARRARPAPSVRLRAERRAERAPGRCAAHARRATRHAACPQAKPASLLRPPHGLDPSARRACARFARVVRAGLPRCCGQHARRAAGSL